MVDWDTVCIDYLPRIFNFFFISRAGPLVRERTILNDSMDDCGSRDKMRRQYARRRTQMKKI